MASVIGISSNLHALSLEASRKVSLPFAGALSSSSDRVQFSGPGKNSNRDVLCLLKACSLQPQSSLARWELRASRLRCPAAVYSPNSVVSENALKTLDFASTDDIGPDFGNEDNDYSKVAAEAQGNEEDLAISNLGLDSRIVEALQKRGISHLFPIQRAVLVPALEGRDIIGRAKTGTGKTLAFGIPIIQKITEENTHSGQRRSRRLPRVLVLAPTRELAKQVEKEFQESATYLSTVCIYGGVSYTTQQNALARGVDVVVGTPGRIIDLVENRSLLLNEVQFLVLDEADQMLAVGFEEPVETILEQLPTERQSMLFSATMPGWVKKLARRHLDDPLTIDLVGDAEEKLAEGIKLYAVETPASSVSKLPILGDLITVHAKGGKSIVFTRTKRDADDVAMALSKDVSCEALHGDISQYQRERTLSKFRAGKFSALIATDVAARGLDIPNVDLVVHYELPNDPETFVHRSGRTGRAGKEGVAILMYTRGERRKIKFLENDVGSKFEYVQPPQPKDVLESSSQHVAKTLEGVHPDLISMFLPTAEKLLERDGNTAMAAALACLSGFSQPPASRSLLTLEKGWTTLQIIKDSTQFRSGRPFTPRDVRGVLSSVWPVAADQVGKIQMIDDRKTEGAVFDLPEDVSKDLLKKGPLHGYTISVISQLPELQEETGLYSGSSRRRGGGRSSYGRISKRRGDDSYYNEDGDDDDDWLSNRRSRHSSSSYGRRSSRPFFGGSNERGFRGSCYKCGESGHRAADCPN
eukprot:TRINITY_DN6866_c0_g1_i1.p1 TRINITY_DN6866_c0_g1~~TRINITY_DN6866_c0_g1_i1.p1  ORF type:complete len:755 (+),score=154.71 TRINITY_DN6866_c0_g1_i1:431-2695(+)